MAAFLAQDRCRCLSRALRQQTDRLLNAGDIRRIHVFLVKHGQYYHPARIEVDVGGRPVSFVLNVAVSAAGIAGLDEEYSGLVRLSRHEAARYIPRAYASGRVRISAGAPVGMWLGEWFDGFHEFHWSRSESGGRPAMAVWDPQTGRRYLDGALIGALYHQAAAILTLFFDLDSFEQIHGWHHAAGDFVLRNDEDRIRLRLVTVRSYRSLLSAPPRKNDRAPDAVLVLQLMLLFLVRLSLRMRLDRFDGVGEPVWAGDAAVPHTVSGFRAALARKPRPDALPAPPLDCFDAFFTQCSRADLDDIVMAVAAAYSSDQPEGRLLRQNARRHSALMFASLRDSIGAPPSAIAPV